MLEYVPGPPLKYQYDKAIIAASLVVSAIMFATDGLAQPACVVRASGTNTGAVRVMYDLPGGDVLIGSEQGIFRFDLQRSIVLPVDGSQTGTTTSVHRVTGGAVAVGRDRGMVRYDALLKRSSSIDGDDTGKIDVTHDLAGGGILIGASKGMFRFDTQSLRVGRVDGPDVSGVEAMFDLPGGGVLVQTKENGWFRFDLSSGQVFPVVGSTNVDRAFIAVLDPLGTGALVGGSINGVMRFDLRTGIFQKLDEIETGQVVLMQSPIGGGVLIGAAKGLFRFDPTTGRLLPIEGAETGSVSAIHSFSNSDVLVGAERGWFRFDSSMRKVVQVDGPGNRTVIDVIDLPSGGALIGTERGLLSFDTSSGQVVEEIGSDTGGVLTMRRLTSGDVLVGAERGWFRFDLATRKVVQVPGVATGTTTDLSDSAFRSPGSLMSGPGGTFFFDYSTSRLRPLSKIGTDLYLAIHPLLGGALIGTKDGLSVLPERRLDDARLDPITKLTELVPRPEAVEVRMRLEHPCARVADKMGLGLAASVDGKRRRPVSVRYPEDALPTDIAATVAASMIFDEPGAWTIQLEQAGVRIGEQVHFRIAGPSLVKWLVEAWPILLSATFGLQVVCFGILLWFTHRSAAAFRMLGEPGWARLVTWPFFFLRFSPAVQRWVLEPWFQAIRRTTRTNVPYLDPPVSTAGAPPCEGQALLLHLRDTRRLWLRGRSGMGKSTIFAAWERAYFSAEGAPTLATAVQTHGFILIMLPVRHYAAVPPPDTNRPESWVLEAVRRRLEQFGLATRDLGLIEVMLRAGHIALALDGTNEADQEHALTAFARQFEMVRLLVTSQAHCHEGWQEWQLPEDVDVLRDRLLTLWVGAEKAAILSRRIEVEGLSGTIVSGYDLRLVADLAGEDPERAPLPANRVDLYRSMLARANGTDGRPLRLEGLKQLAWKMLTDRRREIVSDDEKLLGPGTLKILARDGVHIVRQVGPSYEFRHDQMRAFLAALWLTEEIPTLPAIEKTIIDAAVFDLNRRDQEELWRFVVALVTSTEDLKSLWAFAHDRPVDRAILIAALQVEADEREVAFVRTAKRRRPKNAVTRTAVD